MKDQKQGAWYGFYHPISGGAMTLRCLDAGSSVSSLVLSEEEWGHLRQENTRRKHLRMPCCDAGVVLKTSKLGLRFFSHAPSETRAHCEFRSESEPHRRAKALVARAASAAGWEAITEVPGQSPDGETWIADTLMTRNQTRIAIEIQWSPQSDEETRRRQRRYEAAGIRCLWLMRQPRLLIERETPTFRLAARADGGFDVWLPAPSHYDPLSAASANLDGKAWLQRIDLSRFIQGALQGHLHFAPAAGHCVPVEVQIAAKPCWKCRRQTRLVLGITILTNALFPGLGNMHVKLREIFDPQWASQIHNSLLNNDQMRDIGIGPLRFHFIKQAEGHWLNHCHYCGSTQRLVLDKEFARRIRLPYWKPKMEVGFTGKLLLPEQIPATDLPGLAGWWFNLLLKT